MEKSVKISEWILRIGIFGAFFGHGMFGLAVKQSFIPLITAFGFREPLKNIFSAALCTFWLQIAHRSSTYQT